MKLFSTLAAMAAVVTAQGQDGGVPARAPARAAPQQQQVQQAQPRPATPPPAAATPNTVPNPALMAAADAGHPASAQHAQQQQPPQQPPPQPRTVPVDNSAEVNSLKSKLETQNAKLDSAVKELESIRAENAARAQAEQQRHQRVEAQKQAAVQMGAIDQQLATGDARQVEQAINAMQGTVGPAAQANLELARQALANSDLANARLYLARAAAEAQHAR